MLDVGHLTRGDDAGSNRGGCGSPCAKCGGRRVDGRPNWKEKPDMKTAVGPVKPT